jgi:hypothetical protein
MTIFQKVRRFNEDPAIVHELGRPIGEWIVAMNALPWSFSGQPPQQTDRVKPDRSSAKSSDIGVAPKSVIKAIEVPQKAR